MEKLAKVLAGDFYSPYIIAEISANHNGDFQNAQELVLAAKNAGADAVKLQTFTADSITVNTNRIVTQFQLIASFGQEEICGS